MFVRTARALAFRPVVAPFVKTRMYVTRDEAAKVLAKADPTKFLADMKIPENYPTREDLLAKDWDPAITVIQKKNIAKESAARIDEYFERHESADAIFQKMKLDVNGVTEVHVHKLLSRYVEPLVSGQITDKDIITKITETVQEIYANLSSWNIQPTRDVYGMCLQARAKMNDYDGATDFLSKMIIEGHQPNIIHYNACLSTLANQPREKEIAEVKHYIYAMHHNYIIGDEDTTRNITLLQFQCKDIFGLKQSISNIKAQYNSKDPVGQQLLKEAEEHYANLQTILLI